LERDIDILGAGSLTSSKQYDAFVEVVNELTEEIPDVNARICGDGPEKNGLQSLIDRLHLQENILVEGKKTNTEIFRLMQRSRIFLHTSSYPGWSMVCMEALYAGAMVISFYKPMAAWINHWYIVHDKTEMVSKVLEILNDPETDYRPILPYPVNESVRAVMKLFQYE
jgi:glycosyltransferase involved in cell wall biosynthesis